MTLLFVILFTTFIARGLQQVNNTESRRIIVPMEPKNEYGFVVYIVEAGVKKKYDYWLCGGAIVHDYFVLTSGACLMDVSEHMYVISATTKNVHQPDQDSCTKNSRKKIVASYVPKHNNFDYHPVDRWVNMDIGLAKTESKFAFKQAVSGCSVTPVKALINHDPKYQMPGIDAVVYGWGHPQFFRKPEQTEDFNANFLKYTSVVLYDLGKCIKHWPDELENMIHKYMICSWGQGAIDDKGEVIAGKDATEDIYLVECARRDNICIQDGKCICRRQEEDKKVPMRKRFKPNVLRDGPQEKNGICQNDHGGPLMAWVGAKRMIIGVASAFLTDDINNCEGPFIYYSTSCNGAFIHCVLTEGKDTAKCAEAFTEKNDIARKFISWRDHPDGPAENEIQDDKDRAMGIVRQINNTNKYLRMFIPPDSY